MQFFNILKKRNSANLEIKDLSDAELISQYKNNSNKDIIGELFSRYSHLVFGVCLKYLKNEEPAKEALMQVFEKTYDDLLTYEINSFKNWVYIVAKNHCLAMIKKKSDLKEVVYDFPIKNDENFVEYYDDITLFGSVKKNNYEQKLGKAINELNNEQKICIELFYLQEKSYKEITEITNYNLNQVKSFIQNGKRNLKILLTEGHE
jgi:RNA polymerase sigma-70 factor (ECF subfamily)